MMEKKVIEDRELMAEFAKMERREWDDHGSKEYEWTNCPIDKDWHSKEPPPFDSSWDWLMHVVGLISKNIPSRPYWYDTTMKQALIEENKEVAFITARRMIRFHNAKQTMK